MEETRPPHSMAEILKQIETKIDEGPMTLRGLLETMEGRGKAIVLLLFSLPFCQPIQIPGLSIPFGLAIFWIGVRLGLGRKMWIPKSIGDKQLSSKGLKKCVKKGIWLIKKIQRLAHPRLVFLCETPVFHAINGFVIALLGLFLALPLPIPLTNIIAAWSIFFISLGILEDDGLFILIGYAITLLTAGFIAFLIIFQVKIFS